MRVHAVVVIVVSEQRAFAADRAAHYRVPVHVHDALAESDEAIGQPVAKLRTIRWRERRGAVWDRKQCQLCAVSHLSRSVAYLLTSSRYSEGLFQSVLWDVSCHLQ